MKNLYLHYGARRSGNHGFIYWIQDQMENQIFLNSFQKQIVSEIIKNDSEEITKHNTSKFQNIIYSFENIVPDINFINDLKNIIMYMLQLF